MTNFPFILKVCWIPILKAKKVILAGDPMQLPPTILSLNKNKSKKEKGNKGGKADGTNKQKAEKRTQISQETSQAELSSAKLSISEMNDSESDASGKDGEDTTVTISTETLRKKSTGLQPPRTLETTLFDRLEAMYGPSIKRMLEIQYRSVYRIQGFSYQRRTF
jgi:DNA polymerase alpha-associated DNA helicase A